jgi:hypothetical protein
MIKRRWKIDRLKAVKNHNYKSESTSKKMPPGKVTIILYCALGSARCLLVSRLKVLDYKFSQPLLNRSTILQLDNLPNHPFIFLVSNSAIRIPPFYFLRDRKLSPAKFLEVVKERI